jgi:hypothetical protein
MEVSFQQSSDGHAIVGGGDAEVYTIAQSASFISMLSDAIYSNKPLAMVREVICNGWDAHINAGIKTKPLKITLTDTEVSFEDFGSGIPKDKIKPIYCVYGDSTKEKDEDQTGGFGLGSKAPFAYSSHFTVENSHDGVKTIYAASKGSVESGGKPDFREMGWMPCEQTGLRVIVPLKSTSDKNLIKEMIFKVVQDGGINAKLNERDITNTFDRTDAEKAGFHIGYRDRFPFSSSEGWKLLYGSVLYPIDTAHDAIKEAANRLRVLIPSDAGVQLVLFAKPSTIGVAPSREALSYSDKTIETINDLIYQVIAAVVAEMPKAKSALINSIANSSIEIDSIHRVQNSLSRLESGQALPNVAMGLLRKLSTPNELGVIAINGLRRKFPHYSAFLRRKIPLMRAMKFKDVQYDYARRSPIDLIVRLVEAEKARRDTRKLTKFIIESGAREYMSVRSRYDTSSYRNINTNSLNSVIEGAEKTHVVIGESLPAISEYILEMSKRDDIEYKASFLCVRLTSGKAKLRKKVISAADKFGIATVVVEKKKAEKVEEALKFFAIEDFANSDRGSFFRHSSAQEPQHEKGKYVIPSIVYGKGSFTIVKSYRFDSWYLVEELYPNTLLVNSQSIRDRLIKSGSMDVVQAMILDVRKMRNNAQFLYNVFITGADNLVKRGAYSANTNSTYQLLFEKGVKFAQLFAPAKFTETADGFHAIKVFKLLMEIEGANEDVANFLNEIREAAKAKFGSIAVEESKLMERFKGFSVLMRALHTNNKQAINYDDMYDLFKMAKVLGKKTAITKEKA